MTDAVSNSVEAVVSPAARKFFELVREGIASDAELTVDELKGAAAAIEDLKDARQVELWRHAALGAKTHLTTEKLTAVGVRIDPAEGEILHQNNYVLAAAMAAIESAVNLSPAAKRTQKDAAQRAAVVAAIESQVEPSSARDHLVSLVHKLGTRPTEFTRLRVGWARIVERDDGKNVITRARVDELEEAVEKGVTVSLAPKGQSAPEAKKFPQQLAGKSQSDLQKQIDGLVQQSGGKRLLLEADLVRQKTYQAVITRLHENPKAQEVMRKFKAELAENELGYRRSEALHGGLVLENAEDVTARGMVHPYSQAMWDMAQDVGMKLGFTKPVTLVLASDNTPNAFIYTANQDMPRVTFFTALVERLWDDQSNDWIKVWVDANGKPTAAGAPNARELPVGKYMLESVMMHELGHIRDEVVLNKSLIVYLFETLEIDVLTGSKPEKMPDGDWQKIKASVERLRKEFSHCSFGGPRVSPHGGGARTHADRGEFDKWFTRPLLSKDDATEILRDAFKVDPSQFGMLCWSKFDEELMKLTRNAEATADRYAVVAQNDPRWAALTQAMFHLNSGVASSPESKRNALSGLMRMDPKKWAESVAGDLAKATNGREDTHELYKRMSHPPAPARIAELYGFAEAPDSLLARIRKFEKLDPDQRLLAVIQIFEGQIAPREDKIQKLKRHEGNEMLTDLVEERALRNEIDKQTTSLKPYFEMLEELLTAQGMRSENNFIYQRVMQSLKDGGIDFHPKTKFYATLRHIDGLLDRELGKNPSTTERAVLEQRKKEVADLLPAK